MSERVAVAFASYGLVERRKGRRLHAVDELRRHPIGLVPWGPRRLVSRNAREPSQRRVVIGKHDEL